MLHAGFDPGTIKVIHAVIRGHVGLSELLIAGTESQDVISVTDALLALA